MGPLIEITRWIDLLELATVLHHDPATIQQTELVQVRYIPASECAVDRGREVGEGVRAAHEEVAPGRIDQLVVAAAQQDHAQH